MALVLYQILTQFLLVYRITYLKKVIRYASNRNNFLPCMSSFLWTCPGGMLLLLLLLLIFVYLANFSVVTPGRAGSPKLNFFEHCWGNIFPGWMTFPSPNQQRHSWGCLLASYFWCKYSAICWWFCVTTMLFLLSEQPALYCSASQHHIAFWHKASGLWKFLL